MYNFAQEIEREFEDARNRTGQKKKVREIMAQYGETVQDIENNAPDNVYMEFILAGGRDMLEQVKKEDIISQPQYNQPKQSEPSLQNNDDEVIEEEEEEEEEEVIEEKQTDMMHSNTKIVNDDNANQPSDSKRKVQSSYQLGTLSAKEESNNNPAAIGYDQTGGYSYGTYQIATKNGTMKDYLIFLNKNPEYKSYAQSLNNAGGSTAASSKTPEFANTWKKLAKDSKFNQSQQQFIVQTNLNPMLKKIKDIEYLDIEHRHPVITDVLLSVATQHGATGGSVLLHNAFKNVKKKPTDEEIINIIYDERSKVNIYFKNSSTAIKTNLQNKRFPRERTKALKSLKE